MWEWDLRGWEAERDRGSDKPDLRHRSPETWRLKPETPGTNQPWTPKSVGSESPGYG